jgi:type IV pilus assembly protein PilM
VHLGASTMSLAMVHQGEIAFVFNHMSGGQMLTRSLEQGLGLDAVQSEEYKRTYGLDPTQFQGKVATTLAVPVKVLTDEMQKAIRFFINKNPGQTVSRVLLSGGGAQLSGLIQQVTENLGIEVLMAAPFTSASGAIPQANQAALTVCMGLLMREQVS